MKGDTMDAQVENMTDAEITDAIEEGGSQETTEVVEQETQPEITLESVQQELQETRDLLAKQSKRMQDKEAFIQRQGNEIGELRKLKQALIKRKEEMDRIDPADQMVNDPGGFRNAPYEKANIDRDLRNIEDQERQLEQSAAREQYRAVLMGTDEAPGPSHDLMDNMDAIKDILSTNSEENPELIERFVQDPFSFPPGLVRSLNIAGRFSRENAALKAEIEQLKGKTGTVLEKIEKTARKPLTNQASSPKTTDHADMTDEEIAKLSSEDLERLLKQYGS